MSWARSLTLPRYQAIGRILSPLLRAWDGWRALRQPIYRPHRSERWARQLPVAPTGKPLIWIHAVSVGETQACAPLLKAILKQYPQHAVLLTHMTPTGRATGRELFAAELAAQRVLQCYLPYDIQGLPEQFLQHFRPQLGILMETEVWPQLIAACAVAGCPVGLANGRLSERSLRKALRFERLARSTYAQLSWLAAQSPADAQRFAQLSERPITVLGNLKFDAQPNEAQLQAGRAFKLEVQNQTQNQVQAEVQAEAQNKPPRQIITLASTREGEELALLQSIVPWLNAQAQPPLLMLVPRHPKRSAEIAQILTRLGLSFSQRSAQQAILPSTQVVLGDTLGEMWFYYGASDIAVVGGGWAALGGQNLIEPCIAGCAVIVGPHMFNFAAATQAALDCGAVIQCSGIEGLTAALDQAQSDHTALCAAGQTFAQAHTGSTARHLALMQRGPL